MSWKLELKEPSHGKKEEKNIFKKDDYSSIVLGPSHTLETAWHNKALSTYSATCDLLPQHFAGSNEAVWWMATILVPWLANIGWYVHTDEARSEKGWADEWAVILRTYVLNVYAKF